MKTYRELYSILDRYPLHRVNAHIHTHLCDGKPEMTVENIATAAEAAGLGLVVLVPHFHKQVSDATATLYTDTDVQIFEQLRQEIGFYQRKNGKVEILLSSEVDILDVDGSVSMAPSEGIERNLDFVTPTLNFHPLLPLAAVAVTHTKEVDDFHESGTFAAMAEQAGGRQHILETAYEAMTNAIRACPYPAMVGHFFCAHTIPVRSSTWFGLRPEEMDLVYAGTAALLQQCRETGAFVDITGIHLKTCDAAGQRVKDGFLHGFQKDTLVQCEQYGIRYCAGSDAHNLQAIPKVRAYREIFGW